MNPDNKPVLFVIVGPTASGKTDTAIELARLLKTSVISADSRQMYREMKIGTAAPANSQLMAIKHYFIGNLSITDYYNASMFEFEALDILKQIFATTRYAIMAGGSGLYIDAVCKGIDDLPSIDADIRKKLTERLNSEGIESLRIELKKTDPDYYKTADLKNPKRILKALEVFYMTGKPYSSFCTKTNKPRFFDIIKIGLFPSMEELTKRIEQRTEKMINDGWLEEAQKLLPYRNLNALNTVGYKELFCYFDGHLTLEQAIAFIKTNTRKYAKRQMSYFRRDQAIQWVKPDEAISYIKTIYPACFMPQ